MNIEALQAVGPHDEVAASVLPAAPAPAAGQAAFVQLITEGLNSVNEQLKTSQVDLQQLALGDAQNLHEVMIRLEQSRISFQLAMQVRNRLLEAYQDVMRMQV